MNSGQSPLLISIFWLQLQVQVTFTGIGTHNTRTFKTLDLKFILHNNPNLRKQTSDNRIQNFIFVLDEYFVESKYV